MSNMNTPNWVPAKSKAAEEISIQAGDKIRIYGKETTVEGFYGAYNEGLERWETILSTKSGHPFERSIDVIEVDAEKEYRNPIGSAGEVPAMHIPPHIDQIFSKAASDFVKGIVVADFNGRGMANFAYYQGRVDEYLRKLTETKTPDTDVTDTNVGEIPADQVTISREKAIQDRIDYLMRAEIEEINKLDGLAAGSLERNLKWKLINELNARRSELRDLLTNGTLPVRQKMEKDDRL